MSGVAGLLEVSCSGILIVGLVPQVEPRTAEHVKLTVYVEAAPVGTAGGGGLSALMAMVADAASADAAKTRLPPARQAMTTASAPASSMGRERTLPLQEGFGPWAAKIGPFPRA